MSKLRITIIIIASIATVVCAVMLIRTTMQYKAADNEYSSLEQYAKVGGEDPSSGTESSETEEVKEQAVEETVEEEEKVLTRNYNRADFPDIAVDHEALKKINGSYVCWLYAPGAQINHPVVQGTDNEFYLHHTFEMQKNIAGCVFMDYEVDPMLTSWNTFFYGHNMKNGSMFGHLKNYINDKSVYDKEKYIYVFRPEGIYRYEIFSFYLDPTDSKMYYTCDTFREYRAYLREATKKSVRECEARPDPDLNIVTLVTCSGSGSNKQRFFVHAQFKDYYLF
ncbi:MAG: class B sortase [Lachnospiraceae bacterium]|nr:class B sortase [Lachnospiraceae bacterium]